MPSDRSKDLIADATSALKERDPLRALKLLDEAVEIDPNNADIYGLRGIAFAQVGRAEGATESLRKATMLEPSVRTFYNLAVHLYDIGETSEAFEMVGEALKIDPEHADSQKLVERIAGKEGQEPPFSADGGPVESSAAAHKPKYGFGQKHLFVVLGENQKEWVALGWTIIGLAAVATIIFKFNFPFIAPAKPDMKNALMGYKPINSPMAFATIGLFVTMVLSSMIWTSIDLIDRRGRALWMVPMMVCCFLCLPSLPQTLYMIAGRRDLR